MEEEGHDMPDPVIMINDTLSADNPTNGSSFGSPRCDRPITGMVEAQLRKFRHLLENIYKPALIIGCVLSTTLCVFFRVVVLGCGHSHLEWIWLIPMTFRKFEFFGKYIFPFFWRFEFFEKYIFRRIDFFGLSNLSENWLFRRIGVFGLLNQNQYPISFRHLLQQYCIVFYLF